MSDDLYVLVVTLDNATRQVYRRTDSATLLALLPELRRLSKRTQKEMTVVEQSLPDRADPDGQFILVRDEAPDDQSAGRPGSVGWLGGRDQGSVGPPAHADGVDTVGMRVDETFAAQLYSYSTAVGECERWVRDELKRRGLIPLWPGEEQYLDEHD